MNTRPSTIAAEDLTGPCVLNDQRRAMSPGNFTAATPSKAGPPRNMGQLVVVGLEPLGAAAACPFARNTIPKKAIDAPLRTRRIIVTAQFTFGFTPPITAKS